MQKREKIRKLNKKCANEAKYAKNKQITQNLGKLRKFYTQIFTRICTPKAPVVNSSVRKADFGATGNEICSHDCVC